MKTLKLENIIRNDNFENEIKDSLELSFREDLEDKNLYNVDINIKLQKINQQQFDQILKIKDTLINLFETL